MKHTTLTRIILWIGVAMTGISLWGRVLSPLSVFWFTMAAGLGFMIFSGIYISKEK